MASEPVNPAVSSTPPDAPRAVVLLSGGLDSAVTLAAARAEGFACVALTIDYQQRHRAELQASALVARQLGAVAHIVMPLNLRAFGGSALTAEIDVPKGRDERQMSAEIPVTYVPARNMVFLALASALAEAQGATDLWIGVNAVDYSGYPDCRPAFIASMERTINLATKAGVEGAPVVSLRGAGGGLGIGGGPWRIHAPLVELRKREIVRLGVSLGVDFALTHSCYDPVERTGAWRACGRCDACVIRRQGFAEAGVADPTIYA